MSDFIRGKGRRRAIPGINDPNVASAENIRKIKELLTTKIEILKKSLLFSLISETFQSSEVKVTKIRCVALGSPSQEEPALYQLALLKLLVELFTAEPRNVSLYDPVFTKLDEMLFEDEMYLVEADYTTAKTDLDTTLFFLPHAPLELTDSVIKSQSPGILLANNISTHTERLSKTDLYRKYPIISKLVSLIEKPISNADGRAEEDPNEFRPVISKRKNRKAKYQYVEPVLDYSIIESYFTKVSMVSYKRAEEGEWNNAFTDLAFHRIE